MANLFTIKVTVESDENSGDDLKQAILDGLFSIDSAIANHPDGTAIPLSIGMITQP